MRNKKLKLALSELEKEMEVISREEMKSFKGGGDGTKYNPYTLDEHYNMLASGTWNGGYVEGFEWEIGAGEVASSTSTEGYKYNIDYNMGGYTETFVLGPSGAYNFFNFMQDIESDKADILGYGSMALGFYSSEKISSLIMGIGSIFHSKMSDRWEEIEREIMNKGGGGDYKESIYYSITSIFFSIRNILY